MPLPPPHGAAALRPLLLSGPQLDEERRRAAGLPRLRVTSREKGDLVMLGIGGFTPLAGFMTDADWKGVCDDMRTAAGVFWPIPITLSTDAATAGSLAIGSEVALVDADDDSLSPSSPCRRNTASTRSTNAKRCSARPIPLTRA
jgi:sulfate adenylyltransferase